MVVVSSSQSVVNRSQRDGGGGGGEMVESTVENVGTVTFDNLVDQLNES